MKIIINSLKLETSTYCFSSAICLESVCSIIAKAFLPCLRGLIFSLDNSHSAIFWKKARQKIAKYPLNFCLRFVARARGSSKLTERVCGNNKTFPCITIFKAKMYSDLRLVNEIQGKYWACVVKDVEKFFGNSNFISI